MGEWADQKQAGEEEGGRRREQSSPGGKRRGGRDGSRRGWMGWMTMGRIFARTERRDKMVAFFGAVGQWGRGGRTEGRGRAGQQGRAGLGQTGTGRGNARVSCRWAESLGGRGRERALVGWWRRVAGWWPTQKKEAAARSGVGGRWSVVVGLHRHPRFMAPRGWADWARGGAWQGAQSALRCPWSREQLPCGCQSVVAGAGAHVGVRSFPGRSTERWAFRLWFTRREGVVSQRAKTSVKENGIKALCPRLTLRTGSVGFGSRSQAFLPLQRRKRQGRWVPPDRGQQARQPAGKGQDREIGAGTWQPGRRRGRGLVWAGLGCDCDCFCSFFCGATRHSSPSPSTSTSLPSSQIGRPAPAPRSMFMWSTRVLPRVGSRPK